MKRQIILATAILLTAALSFAFIGCASLQLYIKQPTTQPVTLQERLEAAQHDLDFEWSIATKLHTTGILKDAQWKLIGTQVNFSQAAINSALVSLEPGSATVDEQERLVNAALDAVIAFKGRVK